MTEQPTLEEVLNAWKRLGAQPDARIARALLEEVLVSVSPATQSDGALRQHEGERNLARKLILLMDAEVSVARSTNPKPIARPAAKPAERRARGRLGNGPRHPKA